MGLKYKRRRNKRRCRPANPSWMKWGSASSVLCDAKVQVKLKGEFYQTTVTPTMLYEICVRR
jgi:hypothetical protein